jgi:hypothetical protein
MEKSDKLNAGHSSAFQPKEDFQEYLTNAFNRRIHKDLTEVEELKELFYPLEFFNLFYEQVHFVEQNKTKPVTIQEHLSSLRLNEKHRYFVVKNLWNYYQDSEDEQIRVCCDYINDLVLDLEEELFPEPEQSEPEEAQFDFKKDQEEANKIEDLQERLLFLKKRLKEFNQQPIGLKLFDDYDAPMKLEIDYVQGSINDQQQGEAKPGKTIQPIWWKKSGRLLRYLMDELARLDYIDRGSPVNKHIKEHFIDQNKEPFKESIKQNSSGTGANKGTNKNQKAKPRGHEEIDHLINSLEIQPDQSE